MLLKGEPYEEEVPLRRVVGVTASKGKLCMSLDALPEAMHLREGEGFDPFDDAGMERLRTAVMNEFSSSTSRNGMFKLALQVWNGA